MIGYRLTRSLGLLLFMTFVCAMCTCIYLHVHTHVYTVHHVSLQFLEEAFTLRTPSHHDYYCSMLDGPLALFDSTTYGVNSVSPLNDIDNFHVANGQLPQDIMHVLYEGVMPLNMRLMLNRFVFEEGLFSLETLNHRIFSFPYSRHEAKNKPPKRIEQGHLRGSSTMPFSGNAVQNVAPLIAPSYKIIIALIMNYACSYMH